MTEVSLQQHVSAPTLDVLIVKIEALKLRLNRPIDEDVLPEERGSETVPHEERRGFLVVANSWSVKEENQLSNDMMAVDDEFSPRLSSVKDSAEDFVIDLTGDENVAEEEAPAGGEPVKSKEQETKEREEEEEETQEKKDMTEKEKEGAENVENTEEETKDVTMEMEGEEAEGKEEEGPVVSSPALDGGDGGSEPKRTKYSSPLPASDGDPPDSAADVDEESSPSSPSIHPPPPSRQKKSPARGKRKKPWENLCFSGSR